MQTLYTVATPTATPVALAAGTAKTVISIMGAADFGIDLKKFRVSFDGVTASAIPVLVELLSKDATTAGTSTAITPIAVAGRANAATGFVGAGAYTAEPTTYTQVDEFYLTPNGGTLFYDFANFGDTPDSPFSQGFALRCNAPAVVNVRAALWFARC
jgi:hypothetical protein